MNNILSIQKSVAERIRARRKEGKITQAELAGRSGVPLPSLRRFETTGEVSLASLVRIATALGYAVDFDVLFTRKNYRSLDEIIKANKDAKQSSRHFI